MTGDALASAVLQSPAASDTIVVAPTNAAGDVLTIATGTDHHRPSTEEALKDPALRRDTLRKSFQRPSYSLVRTQIQPSAKAPEDTLATQEDHVVEALSKSAVESIPSLPLHTRTRWVSWMGSGAHRFGRGGSCGFKDVCVSDNIKTYSKYIDEIDS